MKCPIETREGGELLLAYTSGKLDAGAAADLEQHMGACRACRELAAGQRAVWEALDGWETAPVSADFDRRFYRRIHDEISWWDRLLRPVRPVLVRRGLPVAAAASLIVMAGLLLDRQAVDPPMPAPNSAEVEAMEPEQMDRALDDLEMLSRFNHALRAGDAQSKI